jgi:ABC-type oligopeptide transport system substrate-binding subunit
MWKPAGTIALAWVVLLVCPLTAAPQTKPEGTMTWGVHVTLAPTWFDPAEPPGIITPFLFPYALHDALVKPMPDNPLTPSLAETWSESADGLIYEFILRAGVTFHNGDPVTAGMKNFSRYNETYSCHRLSYLPHEQKRVSFASPEVGPSQHAPEDPRWRGVLACG